MVEMSTTKKWIAFGHRPQSDDTPGMVSAMIR